MILLYRGTKDGTTSYKFHEKCDDQGPTICLYKNEKGHIFGGYLLSLGKKKVMVILKLQTVLYLL